ncbi:hypothetical protein DOY81_000725 [Sarcophaga bullata]|nr:hypothetical protein DOY81_000725 [Sarcophaga bullata]
MKLCRLNIFSVFTNFVGLKFKRATTKIVLKTNKQQQQLIFSTATKPLKRQIKEKIAKSRVSQTYKCAGKVVVKRDK